MKLSGLARELPAELRRILSQFESGEGRLVFKHEGLGPYMDVLAKTGDFRPDGFLAADFHPASRTNVTGQIERRQDS